MASNHESLSDNSDKQSMSPELEVLFDTLLRETADKLDPFCMPDEMIFETKDAVFGKYSEDSLMVTHVIAKGKHSGVVSFISHDNPKESFSFHHDSTYGKQWAYPNNGRLMGTKVLQLAANNWPIADDGSPKDVMRKLIYQEKDADGNAPDIPAIDIMEFLEDYTLRRDTGDHSCKMKWSHRDRSKARIINGRTYDRIVTFTIDSGQKDSSRRISTDITATSPSISAPLTCHITSDELGNVSVTADFINPDTGVRQDQPVTDPEMILNAAKYTLDKFVQGKFPSAKVAGPTDVAEL